MPSKAFMLDRRTLRFVLSVFAAVALVVLVSFCVYSSLPLRPNPTDSLTFSDVALVDGNASFSVQSQFGGPYPYGGFAVRLIVNNFPSADVALGPSQSVTWVSIGPNSYRIRWLDSDGDGAPSVGDPFHVDGDGVPLPSLSAYEFDLQWQSTWVAKAFWTTD